MSFTYIGDWLKRTDKYKIINKIKYYDVEYIRAKRKIKVVFNDEKEVKQLHKIMGGKDFKAVMLA